MPPWYFCCIYWRVQVIEPARVKGCRIKPHTLERWVATSHCMTQASDQGWTPGGVKHDSHFYNLWSLWFETICHLLCAYSWPEYSLMTMPNKVRLGRRGKSGYWGGSRGVVSHLHHFSFFDLGFNFYSSDVDECANPRSCPEHSTCHNSLGNYSCVCNTGYESRSGKKNFQGPGETCEGKWRASEGKWRIKSNLFAKTAMVGEKLKWVSAESKALVCRAEAYSHSFIHAFILQILLEHLLYAKHYSRDEGYSSE